MIGQGHIPVLLEEALQYLDIEREGIYIDCTLGLGGHASVLLQRNPGAELIGLDRDPDAAWLAGARSAVAWRRR